MKRILMSLVAISALVATAKEQEVQPGTPAMLEAANGKQARVFLQRMEDGILTFQPYKSTREMSVGAEKIKRLTFFPKYDQEGVQASFNEGDYNAVIATLDPLMEPFWDYMGIDNNLRDAFCLLMDAHRETDNVSKARKAAEILQHCGDAELQQRGTVNLALIALAEGDTQTAKKLRDEVESEAAGLYLQACIERAEKQPKKAIRTVTKNIVEHANDVVWLAPSELLCAYLYMDMIGTNSVITTNSAMNTARQVKNIYGGSNTAADAKKLWVSLGGEAIEVAAAKKKAERAAEEKAAQEAREAEEKAKQEAKAVAKAKQEAETDVKATTEMESE